jgi:phosphate transport system protein
VREIFQSQLQEVQTRLVEIATDSARVIEKASKAFTTSDATLADEAIAIADATGNKALALDELVIKILAKQSPVARDLRVLVSALRISASLERMSALAGHCECALPFSWFSCSELACWHVLRDG